MMVEHYVLTAWIFILLIFVAGIVCANLVLNVLIALKLRRMKSPEKQVRAKRKKKSKKPEKPEDVETQLRSVLRE